MATKQLKTGAPLHTAVDDARMVFVWAECCAADDWVQITKGTARRLTQSIGPDDEPLSAGLWPGAYGIADTDNGETALFLG